MQWNSNITFCPFRMGKVYALCHELSERKSGSEIDFTFFRAFTQKMFFAQQFDSLFFFLFVCGIFQLVRVIFNAFFDFLYCPILQFNIRMNAENKDKSFSSKSSKLFKWPCKVRLNSFIFLCVCIVCNNACSHNIKSRTIFKVHHIYEFWNSINTYNNFHA